MSPSPNNNVSNLSQEDLKRVFSLLQISHPAALTAAVQLAQIQEEEDVPPTVRRQQRNDDATDQAVIQDAISIRTDQAVAPTPKSTEQEKDRLLALELQEEADRQLALELQLQVYNRPRRRTRRRHGADETVVTNAAVVMPPPPVEADHRHRRSHGESLYDSRKTPLNKSSNSLIPSV
jgi:hypothetical protein